MINLIDVLLSGGFGLLVAVLTILLTQRKENRQFQRDKQKAHYEKIELLYTDTLSLLEKGIRCVEGNNDFNEMSDELSRLNARMQLSAQQNILAQYQVVSDLILYWSAEYRMGAPKRLGSSGMAYISSHDPPHKEKAKELYANVEEEIRQLAALMQDHLKTIE